MKPIKVKRILLRSLPILLAVLFLFTLGTYADKMGSCRIVLLPGEHMIYMQKPVACGTIIREFLDELDAK